LCFERITREVHGHLLNACGIACGGYKHIPAEKFGFPPSDFLRTKITSTESKFADLKFTWPLNLNRLNLTKNEWIILAAKDWISMLVAERS
jgi:hypothetical protein